jgi:biotin synthase
MNLVNILNKDEFEIDEIQYLLSLENDEEIELMRQKAYQVMKEKIGEKIYLRGLVEFSNLCSADCYYCGLRKSNKNINRYILSVDEIVESAIYAAENGFGSFVLQSGENRTEAFIDLLEKAIKLIIEQTKSDKLPNGLGITICIGEQDYNTYKRLFIAGAHRYLLRIETSSRDLYSKIHPSRQSYDARIKCLNDLKEIGYQVGTGVMIGLPGQTAKDLANDILFFKEMDVDMIGMGPYLIQEDTPMSEHLQFWNENLNEIIKMALKMIAVTRIVLKDVNIASTTALATISKEGKKKGLSFGANVIMPLLTPENYRKSYKLYENKPSIDKFFIDCVYQDDKKLLYDREVAQNEWGDPKHFFAKLK